MWPTPADVAAGAARILRETVLPAVSDDHAREQLRGVIAVLGGIDWNGAAATLAERAASTAGLLDACRAWIDADPERGRAFSPVASGPADAGSARSYAAAVDHHRRQRLALERFIDELARWRTQHGPESTRELLDRVGSHLAGTIPAAP